MNLRWLLFDYADPALQLSFRQRMKIIWGRVPLKELPKPMRRRRIVGNVIATLPMVAVTVTMPYMALLLIQATQFKVLFILYIPALLFPLSWIWMSIAYGLFLRPEHYYRIRLQGFDICIKCGYWLRGLDETIKKCPECGTSRETMPISKKDKP